MFRPIRIAGIFACLGICCGLVTLAGAYADPPEQNAPSVTAPAAPASPEAPQGGKLAPAPTPAPPPAAAPKTPPFPDVPVSHPAAGAVESVKNKSIMGGKADGKFHGAEYVTRYELAVILDRFVTYNEQLHKPIKQTSIPGPYKVSAPVGHWAHNAQVHLVQDQFLPKDSPILAAPGAAKVTKEQLVDALSQTMIRVSDRSIAPMDEDTEPETPQKPAQ